MSRRFLIKSSGMLLAFRQKNNIRYKPTLNIERLNIIAYYFFSEKLLSIFHKESI